MGCSPLYKAKFIALLHHHCRDHMFSSSFFPFIYIYFLEKKKRKLVVVAWITQREACHSFFWFVFWNFCFHVQVMKTVIPPTFSSAFSYLILSFSFFYVQIFFNIFYGINYINIVSIFLSFYLNICYQVFEFFIFLYIT